jgi:hypothetical protein
MLPGDTQEVVAAIVVGQGGDRLSSITEMKTVDEQAQIVFDLNFDIPSPPPAPEVSARGYDGAIDLTWTPADPEKNWPEQHYQDYIETLGEFYVFEGYNIYQGLSPSGPWTKVATYDYDAGTSERMFSDDTIAGSYYYFNCDDEGENCDSVERPWDFQLIYADVVNNDAGGTEKVITQSGSESGLVNHLFIERSFLDGGPIINNRPYYFAISPYSVNIQQVGSEDSVFSGVNFLGFNTASLEGTRVPITVVPKSSGAVLIDTATHASGPSQGMVVVEYLNYMGDQPEDYTVTFNEDGSWNLAREGTTVLSDQTNQGGGYDYHVVDGLMVRVMGPEGGIAPSGNEENGGIIETQNADGPVTPPDNVFWSLNSTGDYYVSSNISGSSDAARAAFNRFGFIGWESWEFRFTEEGSECYDYINLNKFDERAPFEVWHYSEDDTEPDQRSQFEIYDLDESGGWSWGDLVYVTALEYEEPLPNTTQAAWIDDYILHRVKFNDYSGALTAPATGTVVRFNSTIPNGTADTYTFTTKPTGMQDGTVVGMTLDDVKVVPNPYYNYSVLEPDQFERKIKFTNLPPTECTIRIFNIAGDLVREMVKEDEGSAEFVWDVKTNSGLYVASGIYVYYIEAEGIGDTFGKMIVFTEVEQLNTF